MLSLKYLYFILCPLPSAARSEIRVILRLWVGRRWKGCGERIEGLRLWSLQWWIVGWVKRLSLPLLPRILLQREVSYEQMKTCLSYQRHRTWAPQSGATESEFCISIQFFLRLYTPLYFYIYFPWQDICNTYLPTVREGAIELNHVNMNMNVNVFENMVACYYPYPFLFKVHMFYLGGLRPCGCQLRDKIYPSRKTVLNW
jgi:hypothetical protein